MNEFLRYQKTVFLLSTVLCLIAIGVAFGMAPQNPTYGCGLALGALAGLIKFRLDVLSILRFAQNPSQEGSQAVKKNFHTMAITFGALILAMCKPETFNLWAAFAGVMLPRLILMGDGLLRPSALAHQNTEGGSDK